MPGRIPHEKMPALYAMADAMVYPRKSMRLTNLVTPLKPLEAMAMGKAVIASDVGGHRELIRHGETGLLVPAGDPGALAEALERLARDPQQREALGRQGRRWVSSERTWGRNAERYRVIYRSVTRERV